MVKGFLGATFERGGVANLGLGVRGEGDDIGYEDAKEGRLKRVEGNAGLNQLERGGLATAELL